MTVQISGRAISRRALLAGALVTLAGCGKHRRPTPPAPVVAPDAAALTSARTLESLLLASYDAKIANATVRHRAVLQVARAVHATHLAALKSADLNAPDRADIAVETNLRHALHGSVATLRELSLAAVDGTNAALFASIAASHEASLQ